MKVLAIGRARAGADVRGEVVLHAAEEMRALWQLHSDGVVREMYMTGQPVPQRTIVTHPGSQSS